MERVKILQEHMEGKFFNININFILFIFLGRDEENSSNQLNNKKELNNIEQIIMEKPIQQKKKIAKVKQFIL